MTRGARLFVKGVAWWVTAMVALWCAFAGADRKGGGMLAVGMILMVIFCGWRLMAVMMAYLEEPKGGAKGGP